jgi:hypothetical protein
VTALDVLRVLAWPLVVLVVALGVFKRVDQLKFLRTQIKECFDRIDRLGTLAGRLEREIGELAVKCNQDRGVNARTAQAVADATVELEKISAQVQRMELRPPGGVGIRR